MEAARRHSAGEWLMPLQKGAKPGSKGFKQNIKTEMAAGKPQRQSVAIAYSESGEKRRPKAKGRGILGRM